MIPLHPSNITLDIVLSIILVDSMCPLSLIISLSKSQLTNLAVGIYSDKFLLFKLLISLNVTISFTIAPGMIL